MISPLVKLGGIASILWLVGIIVAAVFVWTNVVALAAVGGILMGISILLLGFTGIGFWQIDKSTLSIFAGIFGIIGGILLLAGGAVLFAGIGVLAVIGSILSGVFLLFLGLILVKEQASLNTQARLGIDLAYPATITTFIAASIHFGGQITFLLPAAPAALLLTIVFLLAK